MFQVNVAVVQLKIPNRVDGISSHKQFEVTVLNKCEENNLQLMLSVLHISCQKYVLDDGPVIGIICIMCGNSRTSKSSQCLLPISFVRFVIFFQFLTSPTMEYDIIPPLNCKNTKKISPFSAGKTADKKLALYRYFNTSEDTC